MIRSYNYKSDWNWNYHWIENYNVYRVGDYKSIEHYYYKSEIGLDTIIINQIRNYNYKSD